MKYGLVETLLLEKGRHIRHLEKHLSRLQEACRKNEYPFDRLDTKLQLEALSAKQSEGGTYRLRLLLNPAGIVELQAEAYDPPRESLEVVFIDDPIPSFPKEQFACKFTDSPLREFYRSAWSAFRFPSTPPFDLLFVNEEGIVTEGTRTNFYIECDGRLITSPLEAGVLPGTYRSVLIEKGCLERPITRELLQQSTRCFLSNALIGFQRASLRL